MRYVIYEMLCMNVLMCGSSAISCHERIVVIGYAVQRKNIERRKVHLSCRFIANFEATDFTAYTSYKLQLWNTRNSSRDEIANVNFLYDDIVHALQNTIDWCINSATDRRGYVLERSFTKFSKNNAMQRPLRHSR